MKTYLRALLFSLPLLALLLASPRALAQAAYGVVSPQDDAVPALIAPLSADDQLDLPALNPEIPSPAAFLGYPLGERFTRYAEVRAYLDRLAATSDRVAIWDYGTTYEERPLTLTAISSPGNLARLAEIQAQRRSLADPTALSADARKRLAAEAPLIVWLAYGVHGNESASTEAALATAYVLAAARGEWVEMLERVVVLLDPLSNPDGRERYVAGFQGRRGRQPNPSPTAREHREAWPGGRYNHYLIDLNRDWTWASQRETRHRLEALHRWQPQVYVDLHEMGSSASYFFPPPAQPVNPEIDPDIVGWLEVFGRGNAAAFDRQGWLYYKNEHFDLFYPGYADSYTSFLGAVGMTYEVGGSWHAGLALELADGSTLTLADRLARHLTSSLATVRTAALHADDLLTDYVEGRVANANRGDAPTYLWAADEIGATELASLLARHGVAVHRLPRGRDLDVRPLLSSPSADRDEGLRQRHFAGGTWVAPSAQPLGNLVRALMEMEMPLAEDFVDEQRQRVEDDLDAAFYDVTAWSLPLAFNVETWVAAGTPPGLGEPVAQTADAAAEGQLLPSGLAGSVRGEGSVGWLLPPSGLATYRAAARLQAEGVPYRLALGDLSVAGRSFDAGTLFVPRRTAPEATEALLGELAAAAGFDVHRVGTSYSEAGPSLGSDRLQAIVPARVALALGDGVAPTSAGALWHLLDRQAEIPVTLVDLDSLGSTGAGLEDLDVLVLPDGSDYVDALGGEAGDAVERWVRAGGVLVAVGDAVKWLRDRELTEVVEWRSESELMDESTPTDDPESPGTRGYGTAVERPLYVPGAVVATRMQKGHPLTVGMSSSPPALVAGNRPLLATGDRQVDVLTVANDEPVLAGLAWPESRDRLAGSLLVAAESVGQGQVITFAQEPAFRLFWRGTMPLFLNAVMFAPSVGGGA